MLVQVELDSDPFNNISGLNIVNGKNVVGRENSTILGQTSSSMEINHWQNRWILCINIMIKRKSF